MAFFSGWSASAGKALLLFGLRHLDILDKDPKNFVDVKVGKETTLEVRDVGLSIKVRAMSKWRLSQAYSDDSEISVVVTYQASPRNKPLESYSIVTARYIRPEL